MEAAPSQRRGTRQSHGSCSESATRRWQVRRRLLESTLDAFDVAATDLLTTHDDELALLVSTSIYRPALERRLQAIHALPPWLTTSAAIRRAIYPVAGHDMGAWIVGNPGRWPALFAEQRADQRVHDPMQVRAALSQLGDAQRVAVPQRLQRSRL